MQQANFLICHCDSKRKLFVQNGTKSRIINLLKNGSRKRSKIIGQLLEKCIQTMICIVDFLFKSKLTNITQHVFFEKDRA